MSEGERLNGKDGAKCVDEDLPLTSPLQLLEQMMAEENILDNKISATETSIKEEEKQLKILIGKKRERKKLAKQEQTKKDKLKQLQRKLERLQQKQKTLKEGGKPMSKSENPNGNDGAKCVEEGGSLPLPLKLVQLMRDEKISLDDKLSAMETSIKEEEKQLKKLISEKRESKKLAKHVQPKKDKLEQLQRKLERLQQKRKALQEGATSSSATEANTAHPFWSIQKQKKEQSFLRINPQSTKK